MLLGECHGGRIVHRLHFRQLIVLLRLLGQHDLLLSEGALDLVNLSLVINLLFQLIDRISAHNVDHIVHVIAKLLLRVGKLGLVRCQVHVGIDGEVSESFLDLRVLLRELSQTKIKI